MSKLNYKTSKDYKQLKELLDSGKEIICIIRSDCPLGNMCTIVRRSYSATHPQEKSYVFSEFGFYCYESDFTKACIARSIEFIEPNGEENK